MQFKLTMCLHVARVGTLLECVVYKIDHGYQHLALPAYSSTGEGQTSWVPRCLPLWVLLDL